MIYPRTQTTSANGSFTELGNASSHGGGVIAHFTFIENCALVLPTPLCAVKVSVETVEEHPDAIYETVKSKRKSLSTQKPLDF